LTKRPPRNEFHLPRLVVCEGRADEAFLRALIKARQLPERHIRSGEDSDTTARGGIDAIGRLLEGIPVWSGFSRIESIVVVVDADDDPLANFARVREQIARLQIYPIPDAPLIVAKADAATGMPSIMIAILPWVDRKGSLETLCLTAALSISEPMAACTAAFARCTSAEAWDQQGKKDAMMLRSLLAASHRKNPAIGLGHVWRDAAHLIPLDHPAFDNITDILARN
jgi:hypothetical protein